MTKTIITLLIVLYSLARLTAIGSMYYYETMRLPTSVVIVTVVCCVLCIIIALSCYLRRLSGKNLRLALFIGSVTAFTNMLTVLVAQPGALTTLELVITGTVFDIIFFVGACTIKIRDTKGMLGRTPFSRVAKQADNQNKAGIHTKRR